MARRIISTAPQSSARRARRDEALNPTSAVNKTACEKTSIPTERPRAKRRPNPYRASNFFPRSQWARRMPARAVAGGKMKATSSLILVGDTLWRQRNHLLKLAVRELDHHIVTI